MKCCFCDKEIHVGQSIIYFTLGLESRYKELVKHSHVLCLKENASFIYNSLNGRGDSNCTACGKLFAPYNHKKVSIFAKGGFFALQIGEAICCPGCFFEMAGEDFFMR